MQASVDRLQPLIQEKNAAESLIVACTPQMYMIRFGPNGTDGAKPPVNARHVFVDEAGYCNLMNAMALFANGVPVTFLGDHKQLPPVCTVEQPDMAEYIRKRGYMEYSFLWSQSALFCESILSDTVEQVEEAFLRTSDPRFTETRECDLTESHRFGPNLAGVLDHHVYMNGISGLGGRPLEIVVIDCKCGAREHRENLPEALAVKAFLERDAPEDFAVLSPYSRQVSLLKENLPEDIRDTRVLTVHKSQGREWDTVILSVQDNAFIDRDVPLRFTSSKTEVGLKLINTAVSRAKRRLVVVCDVEFWEAKGDELIGDLVSGENRSKYYFFEDGELIEVE